MQVRLEREPEAAEAMTEKPPYRVPSMEEIRAVPWNGSKVVSLFSGCGGSCLGLKMAGYRVLYANEFVPAAADTYALNFPEVHLDRRDIRDVKPEEILDVIGLGPGELNMLEGSPSCASFSSAGKKAAGWGEVRPYSDVRQRTDDLYFEYIRILSGLRPKIFVTENVPGLVQGVAKGYFIRIMRELRASGYEVEARILDAQWLGVPQGRKRVFIQGVREDLGRRLAWPEMRLVRSEGAGTYATQSVGRRPPPPT
jgi:DNA (cytosine-5)-methyltransferase 1